MPGIFQKVWGQKAPKPLGRLVRFLPFSLHEHHRNDESCQQHNTYRNARQHRPRAHTLLCLCLCVPQTGSLPLPSAQVVPSAPANTAFATGGAPSAGGRMNNVRADSTGYQGLAPCQEERIIPAEEGSSCSAPSTLLLPKTHGEHRPGAPKSPMREEEMSDVVRTTQHMRAPIM